MRAPKESQQIIDDLVGVGVTADMAVNRTEWRSTGLNHGRYG